MTLNKQKKRDLLFASSALSLVAVVARIRDEILEFLTRSQATLAERARAREERSGENTLRRE